MMLDKGSVDPELARRLCAAFVSYQLGISVATQYKRTPEDVGDLWCFLAALAKELAMKSQNSLYQDLGRLATTIIQ
jgi:hypothetical protein